MNIPQSVIEPFGVIGIPQINDIPTMNGDNDYISYKLEQYARFIRRTKFRNYSVDAIARWFEDVAVSCQAEHVAVQVNALYNPHRMQYSIYTVDHGITRKTVILMPAQS